MVKLWTRGGLSWRNLAVRTLRESWEDEIFGQAARLSFYIFLALPPCLLLLLLTLGQLGAPGQQLRQVLVNASAAVLPDDAAGALGKTVQYFATQTLFGAGGVLAIASAAWTALNGMSALRAALNTAYEVDEDRPLAKLIRTDILLVLMLGAFSLIGPVIVLYTRRLTLTIARSMGMGPVVSHALHFCVLTVLVLIVFGIFYRFAPNLHKQRVRWSTPGAVAGVVLLLAVSGVFRLYFQFMHSNRPTYGPLAGVALLLIWLYLASACLMIGAEMNSEVEKAAAEPGQRDHPRHRKEQPATR